MSVKRVKKATLTAWFRERNYNPTGQFQGYGPWCRGVKKVVDSYRRVPGPRATFLLKIQAPVSDKPMMMKAFGWVSREYPFISKLGRFKTFSAMCAAGAKHGNDLIRERKDALMFRGGQKKITKYFDKK